MSKPLESTPSHAEWTPELLAAEVSRLDALSANAAAKELAKMTENDIDAILDHLLVLEDSGKKYKKYSEMVDTLDEEEEHRHDATQEATSEQEEEEEEKDLLDKLGDVTDVLTKGSEDYDKKVEELEKNGKDGMMARIEALLDSYGSAILTFLKDVFGFDADSSASLDSAEAWSVPETYEGMPVLSRGCAIRLAQGVLPELRVTSSHGPRKSPLGEANKKEFHGGIDIAAKEKSKIEGAELVATEQIAVKKSSDGHGVVALISGREFTYYHVTPESFLTGSYQTIAAGRLFAKVSPTDGKSTAPHIHFAMSGAKTQNPDFAMPNSLRNAHRAKQSENQQRIASLEAQLGRKLEVTTRAGHAQDAQYLS